MATAPDDADDVRLGIIPVYVTVYTLGQNMPVSKWSAEIAVLSSDKDLQIFKKHCLSKLNLTEKCQQLGVSKFCVEIANRSFDATPLFKDGRVFLIDIVNPMDFLLVETSRTGIALPIGSIIGEITSMQTSEEDVMELADEEELVALQAKASIEVEQVISGEVRDSAAVTDMEDALTSITARRSSCRKKTTKRDSVYFYGLDYE